jgi:hypothetical protein
MWNRTVGRPPSRTWTASGRSHPSSARPSSAPCTTRGSVRPVHSFRYTSRAVNGHPRPPRLAVVSDLPGGSETKPT